MDLYVLVNSSYFPNPLKQAIYEKILGGETILYGEITQALMKDQFANWKERNRKTEKPEIQDTYSRIQSFSPALLSAQPEDIKKAFDESFIKSVGKTLTYNSQAISVVDTLQDGKLQSYSGTMLLMLALREAWGKDKLSASNMVAIYESGHVLPGYVVKKDDGWHLYGIETTVEGAGRIVYGPISAAVNERMLRIVDADYFAIVDLFKFDADNIVDLANEALRKTAEKYEIPSPPYLVAQRFRRETDYGKIAWSPFSFGSPDVGTKDRVRVALEESPRSKLPRTNPNITIIHKPAPPKPEDPAPEEEEGEGAMPVTPTLGRVSKYPRSLLTASADEEAATQKIEVPTYPYRQIPDLRKEGEVRLQCWNYDRNQWMDMPHELIDEVYWIHFNPCDLGKGAYEPLPEQIKIRAVVKRRPRYGYGGYDYDDDYYEDYYGE